METKKSRLKEKLDEGVLIMSIGCHDIDWTENVTEMELEVEQGRSMINKSR